MISGEIELYIGITLCSIITAVVAYRCYQAYPCSNEIDPFDDIEEPVVESESELESTRILTIQEIIVTEGIIPTIRHTIDEHSNPVCVICMEQIILNENILICRSCSQCMGHTTCTLKWLKRHPSCPCCRTEMI